MKTKHLLIALAAIGLMTSCGESSSDTDWPKVKTENKPFTRWWWLGNAVDKENLTRSLEAFSEAGMGGVEIASIYGVQGEEEREIAFLSPEWLDVYAHTVNEAKRLNMIVDLTNGTGWPFGGPTTTLEDASSLYLTQTYTLAGNRKLAEKIVYKAPEGRRRGPVMPPEGVTLECVMAYSKAGAIEEVTDKVATDGTLDWTAPAGEWTIYALFNGKSMQMVKRMAPGGEGLVVDHLNKDALERYLARFDDAFITSDAPMPRMFFNDSYEVSNSSWTPGFLGQFEKRRGYKLQDHLPEFLANDTTELSRRVVSDYRLTINEMLVDNFIIPWTEWVHRKGSKVRNQSHGSPGNILDIYAMVDIPECETFGRTAFDIPGLQVDSGMRLNDSNPAVLKFASSAAHITGKTLTSAETFTWLTEHFRTSLSQCKPEIDQMFASGVNHVFFHGTPYSPSDAAWPGWLFYASVNMSPTNTIWRDAPAFFQYITRCQSFLQSGKSDNDFLLYVPFYDFWNDIRRNQYLTFAIHGMVDMLPHFNETVSEIMNNGYDTDYISDKYIASLKFENGEFVTDGGARYKALILPNCQYMPTETLEKVLTLAQQGGTVIFTERYPSDVPGLYELAQRQEKMKTLTAQLPTASFGQVATHDFGSGKLITGTELSAVLPATGVPAEAVKKEHGVQYTRRSYEDGHIYFMTMLQNRKLDGWVALAKPAESVMIFDPMSGAKGLAKTRTENGQTQVYLQLRPDESVILKTFDKKRVKADEWVYTHPESNVINLETGWNLSFLESEPAIPTRFEINTLGSWTDLPDENAQINMGTALYTVKFNLPEEADAREWELNLGDVRESAKVRINGKAVGTIYAIPFTARVGNYLKPGENTLEVEVTNLPANRIADYDRRGVEWRIFKDINIVNIFYTPMKYDIWETVPSGLLGPVTLTPMASVF